MQAYRPPVQPYFPQAPFPQSQPGGFYPQYAPYPGFMPPVGGQVQQPFPGVYPVEQYEASRPQFPTPGPRSKPLNRSQSAVVPPKPGPLKSIMKKKAHDRSTSVGGGAPMSRSRTNSTTHPRPDSRANSSTRSRADSNLRFVPGKSHTMLHM